MRRQEFIDRKNRYFKAIALPGLAELAVMLIPPLVLLVAVLRLKSLRDPWVAAFFPILLVAHIAVWSWGLRRFALCVRKTYTGLDLQCPHCQKGLTGPRSTKRVIASGKCSHCGGQVLDDVT
jgi:hypothetical protein